MRQERLKKLVDNMRRREIRQILVSSPESVFYLTGVWLDPGERLMVLYINDKEEIFFVVNSLFRNNAGVGGLSSVFYDDDTDPIQVLGRFIIPQTLLGIDKNWPARFLLALMESRRDTAMVNASYLIDELRMIKSTDELETLRQSSVIADSVVRGILPAVKENVTERQLARQIGEVFEHYGVSRLAFDTIVSFGPHAADPHHAPDDTRLKSGDAVVIDIGGVYRHYCSDITRTFFFGPPCAEAKRIYELVLAANRAAVGMIKPGVNLSDIDRAARSVIARGGYGEFFNHRTGHNIGIEDHEYPSVAESCRLTAQAGMVFSIEPGIYIPGKYGVRIEDLIIVTDDGVEVMNKCPREMMVI